MAEDLRKYRHIAANYNIIKHFMSEVIRMLVLNRNQTVGSKPLKFALYQIHDLYQLDYKKLKIKSI